MKFRDLKIGTQLKISFILIMALIAFLGVLAWEMNTRLASQTKELYEHPHTVRKAVGILRADVLLIQRGMKDLCLVKSEEEIPYILEDIEEYKAEAEKQFEILYDRYLGPRTDIDSAVLNFTRWNSVREETIRLLRQGDLKGVISRTRASGAGGHHAEMMLGNVKAIDIFSSNKSIEFYDKAVGLSNRLKYQLVIAVAAVLLLNLLMVIIINRNIQQPLGDLTRTTKKFKEGDLESRSSYQSLNEFGILSSAFNEMADSIYSELKLNNQSAQIAGIMLSEDDAHNFSKSLLSILLEFTGAQMGALYLHNDEKTDFELFDSIGLDHGKALSFSVTDYEGEIGAAIVTRKIQHIRDIPKDSEFTYSAISGKFKPQEIITIPLVVNNEVIAVISLAGINYLEKNSLPLLETIITTLSARMDGILAYRKVVDFSSQLEEQNRELERQKQELSIQASEMTQQNVELVMQKNQVDEANRLKTVFLSNMSHELRTPLNSVIALSGVLNRRLRGKVPEEEYSYLDVIERNGKQLLELINDILDISRIESGKEEVEIGKFNISQLIDEVIELVEPQAMQKKIYLKNSSINNLPEMISDIEKCRHILQNIVANAVKFTETGGVEITARTKNRHIHISVSDTGIGIDKEFLPKIFEEFRQADTSNTRKYGGTGLGLSIAKKYAELLGGKIEVESIRDRGSKFTLILPLNYNYRDSDKHYHEAVEPAYRHVSKHLIDKETDFDARTKTILLVEDMEPVIIQLKDFLEAQHYNILVARDGSEALQLISGQIPDAMILDLMMPKVDGFEVLRTIREKKETARIPVIILTAKYITKEELSFLKHNNVHQLIQKGNVNKEQLLKAVYTMMMPVKKEEQIIEERKPVIKHASEQQQAHPSVLVVEDNADNMITIKALLPRDCHIIEAIDGALGLEMARKFKPQIILLDIALPGMNGIDVLKILRKDHDLKHIPVIAVTASAMKNEVEEIMASGFNGYVSKPIDHAQFENMINKFIAF